VLYFTAPGCVPCRTVLKPALQRLVVEFGNRFQILEVNAEQQPEAASYWNVLSVPTIFVLDPKGEPRHVHYGVASQEVLRSQLGDWLNPSRQVA
jgi:thioredoxin 1